MWQRAAWAIAVMGVAACAGAQRPKARVYACGDEVTVDEQGLEVGAARARDLGHDHDGEHYVLLHRGDVLEYVVPDDPREDAMVHARHGGTSDRCAARGGYADLLERWLRGDSVDKQRLLESLHWAKRRVIEVGTR